MRKFWNTIKAAAICFAVMTVVCGVIYPGSVTGIAQIAFHDKAGGSIIAVRQKDGTVIKYGSEFVAWEFTRAGYLMGRPMGPTNLSAVSEDEAALVNERIEWLRDIDPANEKEIPPELVTASGSGADPYISPEAAEYQVARIARERDMSEDDVRMIINRYTTGKFLGIFGNEGVNVLKVNLALDGLL